MPGAVENSERRWMTWGGSKPIPPMEPSFHIRLQGQRANAAAPFDAFHAESDDGAARLFTPRSGFQGWSSALLPRRKSMRALIVNSQRRLIEGHLVPTELPALNKACAVDFRKQLLACDSAAELNELFHVAGISDPAAREHALDVWLSAHFNYPSWRDQFSNNATLSCARILHAAIHRLSPQSTDIPVAFQLLQKLHILGNLSTHDAITAAHVARGAGFDETLAFETVSKLLLTSPHFELFRHIDTPSAEKRNEPPLLAPTIHYLRYHYERIGRSLPALDMDPVKSSEVAVKIAFFKLDEKLFSWPAALHAESAADALSGIATQTPGGREARNTVILTFYEMAMEACPPEHRAGRFTSRVQQKLKNLLYGNDAMPPDGNRNGGCSGPPFTPFHVEPGDKTLASALPTLTNSALSADFLTLSHPALLMVSGSAIAFA